MKMMLSILSLVLLVGLSAPAEAANNVQSKGNFGLGVALGYPGNGLSMNYFLTKETAIQGDISLWTPGGKWFGVGLRADFLWYPVKIAGWDWGDLTWYWGPGINFHYFNWTGPGSAAGYAAVGVELPIAIGLQFEKVPIDVNLEAVPVLNILGNGGVSIGFGIAGVLNARYYF